MKVLIDISEDDFIKAKEDSKTHLLDRVWSAVANGIPLPVLTDSEQRLFLSAMSREMKVCKNIDEDKVPDNNVKMLAPLCRSIERKVKEVLFQCR